MGKWIPVSERSFLSTLVFNGTQFGTILTLSLSGVLAEKWGWQAIFYVFGGLSVLIAFSWIFCVYESPSVHPRISEVIIESRQNKLVTIPLLVKKSSKCLG